MDEGKEKYTAGGAVISVRGSKRTNIKDLIAKAKLEEKKEKKKTLVVAIAAISAVAASVMFASL